MGRECGRKEGREGRLKRDDLAKNHDCQNVLALHFLKDKTTAPKPEMLTSLTHTHSHTLPH